MELDFLTKFIERLLSELPLLWTFILLTCRHVAIFLVIPGLGQGASGLMVRLPAILLLSFAALFSSQVVSIPGTVPLLLWQTISELLLGFVLGCIPLMIVSGVHAALQLASTSIGLNAASLIDPTFGTSSPEISRIGGDLSILLFLFIGGHHIILYAASGMSSSIIPGSFFPGEMTVELLIDRTGALFKAAMLFSAPVVIALLLTQFVMGLITKAVPTVNVFVMSFPITALIGLTLVIMSLPGIMKLTLREFSTMELQVSIVAKETSRSNGASSPSKKEISQENTIPVN